MTLIYFSRGVLRRNTLNTSWYNGKLRGRPPCTSKALIKFLSMSHLEYLMFPCRPWLLGCMCSQLLHINHSAAVGRNAWNIPVRLWISSALPMHNVRLVKVFWNEISKEHNPHHLNVASARSHGGSNALKIMYHPYLIGDCCSSVHHTGQVLSRWDNSKSLCYEN